MAEIALCGGWACQVCGEWIDDKSTLPPHVCKCSTAALASQNAAISTPRSSYEDFPADLWKKVLEISAWMLEHGNKEWCLGPICSRNLNWKERDQPASSPIVGGMDLFSNRLTNEEVWLRAWCATIGDDGVSAPEATKCADMCLDEFKKRFRNVPMPIAEPLRQRDTIG